MLDYLAILSNLGLQDTQSLKRDHASEPHLPEGVREVLVLAIPDPRGSLVQEAERFAARAKAVQERAVMDARATSVLVTAAGYGFDRRERSGWSAIGTDERWTEGTAVALGGESAARIVFDSTGFADPGR